MITAIWTTVGRWNLIEEYTTGTKPGGEKMMNTVGGDVFKEVR